MMRMKWLLRMAAFGAVTAAGLVECGAATEWEERGWGRSWAFPSPIVGGRGALESLDAGLTGMRFTNAIPIERHLTNQTLLNGSGVAAGDVDGDGWCDVYLAGLAGGGRLFRNLGNWKFADATDQISGLPAGLEMTGVCLTDLDGDGDLDLGINSVGGGTWLLNNDGRGVFRPFGDGLNRRRGGSSLAFADIDGDGDLDGYIANYRMVTIRDQPNTRFSIRELQGRQQVVSVDGVPVSDPDLTNRFIFRITAQGGRGNFSYDENGEADVLLRNEGGGRFVPVPFTGGAFLDEAGEPLAVAPLDWGLSVAFRDINGDGAPDLYVCNDFKSPDRLWLNDGRGRFRLAPALMLRQLSLSSMGVDFADVNRDGWDDFFVVDMLSRRHSRRFSQRIDIRPEMVGPGVIEQRVQYPRNTMFLNRGDGSFAQVAHMAGLEATEWSWAPVFLDVDLDGFEDLLVSNGFERDGMNVDVLREIELAKRERQLTTMEQLSLRRKFPRLATANLAFRNLGGGRFEDVSVRWGFDADAVSQGMCLADLDNDGDLDVLVNNMNAPALVYRNNAAGARVAVRLKGLAPNTRGIGARIAVTGGPVTQAQEMMAGGRYLSSDDATRTFAAGTKPLRIEVTWRSGRVTVAENVGPNSLCEVYESAALERVRPVAPSVEPLFVDASALLNHLHVEEPFDDFARQPTLSRKLSQLGPGVAWMDLDGDGWEDLVIGSGRGGSLAVYRNNAKGGFERLSGGLFSRTALRDQSGVVAWRGDSGGASLLVGTASYEDGMTNGVAVERFEFDGKPVPPGLPDTGASAGPLAMADVNGDGELDLFVGGRVVPGRFPQAASSMMYRQRGGRFERNAANDPALANIGMVSGAVFSDLDRDGDPDLILACDWGALKILSNTAGRFSNWDATVVRLDGERTALSRLTGWWNGVTTGDFDGDGRMDIIASNWGRNTAFESFRNPSLLLYHGALGADEVEQCIEGYTERETGRTLPLQPLHVMGLALPAMRERVGSFGNYAKSALSEIYGDALRSAGRLEVTHLDTTVLLNRGDHFVMARLPDEVQWAPAFAVCVGDFDGDGAEDAFLSQNFFAMHPEHSRLDAGRGLLLRGNGRGEFSAMPGSASGILVHGEQRGAAACDYDADGRLDLVVTQNAAATKLLRNRTARPGVRVRLKGPTGNSSGTGAVLRLVSGGKAGPAREIHAGSGYWSQDGAVQILAMPESGAELSVRWPGGLGTTSSVPATAREVQVDVAGKLTVVR